jgi:hypothetical protein
MRTRLLVVALGAAACSAPAPTTDSGTPDSGPQLGWADACARYVGAQCAAYQQCQPERFAEHFSAEQQCVQIRGAQCLEARQAPGNSATPDMLTQCTAQIGNLDCTAYPAFTDFPVDTVYSACHFTGTLSEGAGCIDDGQCASGACAHFHSDSCGTCVTPDASQPCFLSAECPGTQVCRYSRCTPQGELDAGCDSENACRASLVCRNGHCGTPAPEGNTCDTSLQDCAANLYCTSQGCVRAQLKVQGDRCGIESNGSWFLCSAGLKCIYSSMLGHNECVPAGDAGTPCYYADDCMPGLTCFSGSCGVATAAACTAPQGDAPNPTYPAMLPSVPKVSARSMGSQVLATPKMISVTFTGDPFADVYEQLVAGVGATSYWQATTQEYGVGPLLSLAPKRAPVPPPNPVTDAQIRSWIETNIDGGFLPPTDGELIYTLFMPRGTVVNKGSGSSAETSCADFFGYHSQVPVNGVLTPYAVIDQCMLQPSTSTLSHEAIEAVTDPFAPLDGGSRTGFTYVDNDHLVWLAFSESELADLCEAQPLSRFTSSELGQQVQRTWSNASMGAFHTPCVPALPGQPYFVAVPDTPDTVPMMFNGVTKMTKGISLALGATRTVPVTFLSDGPVDGPWHVSAYDLALWNGGEPLLQFSFDTPYGLNGDTRMMTITALAKDSTYGSEPFIVVSHRGRVTNYWFAIVGNP